MVRTLSCGLLLLAVLSGPMVASAATVGPSALHRAAVDESRYPWSSIGKLYNEAGISCSGVVIASDKILTAAHCLFNQRTRRFVTADALHFLVGYRTGRYSVHARVSRYEIGPGFNPLYYDATSNADWAVLTTTEPLPVDIEPLRLSRDVAPSGTKAVLVGYPQDRAFAMTADRDCELLNRIDAGRLYLHTCRGTKGYSGAPILVSTGEGDVQVAGLQIATLHGSGADEMLAVPADNILIQAKDDDRTAGVQASAACVAEAAMMSSLTEIQGKLGFLPQQWVELDAARFKAEVSAMAWFAMEPFALAVF